ncbi:Solute carrier family 23 member 2 [Mizuhopecten yessoensis]|uniref:Solute carrier family 23 member 2 n=1 Tax=Mizuhopecten yessoensis TaxID=6573 RepID=A0A210QVP4_MIZYE|nr:Solute carrier family 23 member 2 [Mizuhopecten yessoensis]
MSGSQSSGSCFDLTVIHDFWINMSKILAFTDAVSDLCTFLHSAVNSLVPTSCGKGFFQRQLATQVVGVVGTYSEMDMEMHPTEKEFPRRSSDRDGKSEVKWSTAEEMVHDPPISYEVEKRKFVYDVLDDPPLHLTIFFGLQQALLSLSLNLTTTLLVADLACGYGDELLKAELLSTTLFASGMSTLLMVTIGVRLPIYQGPALAFVTPLVALKTLPDWKCPNLEGMNNATVVGEFNQTSNSMSLPTDAREEIRFKLQMMQGSLMVAGILQTLLGATGLIGRLLRFIGPITVVPVLFLIGISIYKTAVKFCNAHFGVAFLTFAVAMVLSLYLEGRKTPIPFWSKTRGFHIIYYPLHTVFSLLIAIVVGWSVSILLTTLGSFSDDPNSAQYFARTDSRLKVIEEASWFYFPYPGQFGPPRFSLDVFVTFLIATLISVIDSVGDYYAVARICDVPPPPTHAVNRGILMEGIMSIVAGSLGAGHATTSYGPNIGAIGFTKVYTEMRPGHLIRNTSADLMKRTIIGQGVPNVCKSCVHLS